MTHTKLCTTPSHVVSYAIENADKLHKTLGVTKDTLVDTLNAITIQQTADKFLDISSLLKNMDMIKSALFQHNAALQKDLENSHNQTDKQNKTPFKESAEYKKLVATNAFLGKLFSDFLHSNNITFIDWAVANQQGRNIIEKLLTFDEVSQLGGNLNQLPSNQRTGKKGSKQYSIAENAAHGTLTETLITNSL